MKGNFHARFLGGCGRANRLHLPGARSAMRITLLTATLTLAAIINTLGAEFYKVESGPEPDHLVPTRAPGEYGGKIAKNLFATDGRFGRMVVLPSFEPEFCLSVHADIPQASLKKHDGWWSVPDEEKTYILTLTYAEGRIWGTIPQGGEKPKHESVRVKRIDRRISLELAVAIQRVWGKALQLHALPLCRLEGPGRHNIPVFSLGARVGRPGGGELAPAGWPAEGFSGRWDRSRRFCSSGRERQSTDRAGPD